MDLDYYVKRFRELGVNRSTGHGSPHKICMLLAVTDLIESVDIYENKIRFGNKLLARYIHHFNRLRKDPDQPNPHMPFYHLKSEGYWHHTVADSQEYTGIQQIHSEAQLRRAIQYVYLDEPLFAYMTQPDARNELRDALMDNLGDGDTRNWSWLECELTVSDYFDMFTKELSGEHYSKAEHRRALMPRLNQRSEGSIEYKHQNISAVLIDLGYPYIKGYKPAFNYQDRLKEAVIVRLDLSGGSIDSLASLLVEPVQINAPTDWSSYLDDAPDLEELRPGSPRPDRTPRYYNFAEQENANRELGDCGEKWVLELERVRLNELGRPDLAEEVEWTAKKRGDGAGYDIRSFSGATDIELFIEVKTTNSGKYQPFYISQNEVDFSQEHSEKYSLYRVFQFKQSPKAFILPGTVAQHVHLTARQYKATFR